MDKGSGFYNRSMRSWLQDNNIEMYSTHKEGKSGVTKRFIRTLKTKITQLNTRLQYQKMCFLIKYMR